MEAKVLVQSCQETWRISWAATEPAVRSLSVGPGARLCWSWLTRYLASSLRRTKRDGDQLETSATFGVVAGKPDSSEYSAGLE